MKSVKGQKQATKAKGGKKINPHSKLPPQKIRRPKSGKGL